MKLTKVNLDINDFPMELHPLLKNGTVYDSSCSSNAKVYYLDSGFFLKIDEAGELKREAELTKTFFERGLGVEVVSFISKDKDYMVTRAAVGKDATHYLEYPKMLCEILAKALLELHRTDYDNVSMSTRMERYLESAENRDLGVYEEYVLLNRFRPMSKEEAWEIMQENKHKFKCDTLIHGDYCLPNVILNDGKFSTLIDFNMAGVGDKHIDLYWALWSLSHNLQTDEYQDYFLDLYGRENFDYNMLKVIAAFEVFG